MLRMYACVGAPGESEGYGLAKDGSKSRLHLCLHRVSIRLGLRAMEVCASICDG